MAAWAVFRGLSGLLVLSLFAAVPSSAQVQERAGPEERVSVGDYGGIGLLQMRTARFGPDGLLNIVYSRVDPNKRYSINIHIVPWLETTFRYTEIRNKLYTAFPGFSGFQSFKDRGADVKVRLWKESDYLPAVAVGLQDMMGTGLWEGEYLVASKRYRDFDFSVGLGWGSIGSGGDIKNPFANLSSIFASRAGTHGEGGVPSFSSFFSGATVGLFGGVEYFTPWEGLSLKIESANLGYNPPDGTSPWNIGINFRPYPWLDFSFGVEHGIRMIRFALRSNLNNPGVTKFDLPPPSVGPRPQLAALVGAEEALGGGAAPTSTAVDEDPAAEMFETLGRFGLEIEGVVVSKDEMILEVTTAPAWPARVSLRAAAAAALAPMPGDITALTLVHFTGAIAAVPVTVLRSHIRGGVAANALFDDLDALGVKVVAVELAGDGATVTVAPQDLGAEVDLAAVARIAAEALDLDSATAVDSQSRDAETSAASGATPVLSEFVAAGEPWFQLPPLDPPYSYAEQEAVAVRMAAELEAQGIFLEALELYARHADVYVTPLRFHQVARNYGYTAQIIANNLPAPIEEVTIISLNGGMEVSRLTFFRSELERAVDLRSSPEELLAMSTIEPGLPGWRGSGAQAPGRYPRFGWSVAPQTRQHIGGPNQFILYQIWLAFRASLDMGRGFSVTALAGVDLYNNFNRIKLRSDSQLPRVRSNIKEYLQQGANNIVRLQADYMFKPAEDLYARVSAGIFEEMYGGIGAEVLYRPFDSRVAVGLEANEVTKRGFDQRFKFQDYSVATGHLTMYYNMPYSDMLGTISAGRYLAGDTGVTFDLSRRFDSGVRIGAWATFTNVTFEQFGEGSFDKGFYFVIPFELFFSQSSTATGVFAFRPLFRDGGQRLIMGNRLIEVTGVASRGEVMRDWPQFLK